MSNEIKPEKTTEHEGFEHQDLQVSGILYFLLSLVVGTAICLLGIRGVYAFLDHREKTLQPPVNPLATNVPTDTRHIAPEYPQGAFPNPRLEVDERGQLNDDLVRQENTLYSYGWVDEKAGTVRIPIDRAMDLLVQRGLPVRPQGTVDDATAPTPSGKKGKKK
jgi:hypothetical protein